MSLESVWKASKFSATKRHAWYVTCIWVAAMIKHTLSDLKTLSIATVSLSQVLDDSAITWYKVQIHFSLYFTYTFHFLSYVKKSAF